MNLYFPYDNCLVIFEFKQSRIINSYIFHRCTKSSNKITLHKAKHAIGSCYVSNEIYKYMLVPKSRTCALCTPTAQHWLSGYTVKNLCKWEEFLSFLLGRADLCTPTPCKLRLNWIMPMDVSVNSSGQLEILANICVCLSLWKRRLFRLKII